MGLAALHKVWEEDREKILAVHAQRDSEREAALPIYLGKLASFLSGDADLPLFRGQIDSLTKTENHWGAGGMSNQMMFNQLVNAADPAALTAALKAVLPRPEDEESAALKLTEFLDAVEAARDRVESSKQKPDFGRVNSFVSFFWELQDPDDWPRFFPNSRNVLVAEGLLKEDTSPPAMYLSYRSVMTQLKQELDTTTWGVEHLLWYIGVEMEAAPPTPPPQPTGTSVYEHYAARGLVFPDEVITSLVLSLATKRFVILSGISGTGKTQIAVELARYLESTGGQEPIELEPPESDESNLFFRITAAKLKRNWTTLKVRDRKIIDEALGLPERGTSKLFSARLPDGSTGELRVNNVDFTDASRELYPLNFKKKVGDWLKLNSNPGEYLHIGLGGGTGADLDLELVKGEAVADVPAQSPQRHATIAVKSEWTDPRGLIGYFNPLLGRYMPTKLIKLLSRAAQDPTNPYVVILDEMNLARVEYYFSDFLSSLESEEPMELMPLDPAEYDFGEEEVDHDSEVPPDLDIPPNVSFIGTVNVDETTHAFSPKVLDRANVIEFSRIDIERAMGGAGTGVEDGLRLKGDLDPAWFCNPSKQALEPKAVAQTESGFKDPFKDIHSILEQFNRQFGYRVIAEVSAFVGHALEKVDAEKSIVLTRALDLQLRQKVIPKLSGGPELEEPLATLLSLCLSGTNPQSIEVEKVKSAARAGLSEGGDGKPLYPDSARKLLQMLDRLADTGFVGALDT